MGLKLLADDGPIHVFPDGGYAVGPEGDESYVKNMLNVYGLLGNCLREDAP
jgi:hypothetical protein